MSGHSKWSKVKHQKAVEDVKKGQVFSKLAKEISAAAKGNADLQTNPTLKTLVEKARSLNMPKENIERALARAQERGGGEGEAFVLEAYARDGQGLIIHGVTDNRNRALSEIKHILSRHDAKLVGPGGVSWSFDGDTPKTTKPTTPDLQRLIKELQDYSDITRVLTDAV